MPIRVLLRDYPHRAIALATDSHVLTFRHSPSTAGASTVSLGNGATQETTTPRCMVEFSTTKDADLTDYRSLSSLSILGTLGLVTINQDIFLCVVNGAARAATLRPGEHVQKITSVEFHCINKPDYDYIDQINRYPVGEVEEDGFDPHQSAREQVLEHPCLALKKLLSGGSFYYSADFDLTRRLQDRTTEAASIALDSIEGGFLWNSYMIQPLVSFRSRLSEEEKEALDASRILTSAIRGFAYTITVPAASSPLDSHFSGMASTLTLVSRLSSRRAGTRFNARGIDDDGNVANFVETETIFWAPTGVCFSYVQTRGSVPLFWEQASGFTPGQQKISIARSAEATQPAFNKHFAELEANYGLIHIVNLLSNEKSGELELKKRYRYHVHHSPLNEEDEDAKGGSGPQHHLLRETDYDFHAETRAGGYEAAKGIKRYIQDSIDSFAYYISEEVEDEPKDGSKQRQKAVRRPMAILQQQGVFRTNCLDCLDRTNLVQTLISELSIGEFLSQRGERRTTSDFWVRHSTLWADNGDALSRIYAGTGALKSSFTRSGKMSFAGALADVRKSATRLYINNFEDKGRQETIDRLLGRLMGQVPVHLYDPINDWVSAELTKRMNEYTATQTIHIWAGTFNLNGKTAGIGDDLSPWLCPPEVARLQPEIVAVGFQEIVELSPQQIMSTDPNRRQAWEEAVKNTLNIHAQRHGSEEYVLLRGGQLVGASLSVFVKASVLPYIKNVEGSLKKTGLSGMAGNKGAVAIRMEYANTSICLVTAHLAAGFANYEERNQDYRTISHGLKFQRNRTIEDHDTIIWLGDFNYRIGMSNERVRQLVKAGGLETLYENDQLNLQMVHGKTFPHYSEARITFMPTYKFDNGTDNYDTSDKARIPAWCDRVLTKGNNLRQTAYDSAPLRFSDHKPVYATFQCTISVVDEKKKTHISDQLYEKRRAVVGDTRANTRTDITDDEDLIGYDSIEPGLPPASSDRRKWWLDGGLPARSGIQPPGPNYTPNPSRPANPFTPTSEPDWVKVDRPSPPPSRRLSPSQTPKPAASEPFQASLPAREARKLPPPLQSSPARNGSLDGAREDPKPPLPDRTRSISTSSTASASRQTLRKPAPPVPNKPSPLRSESRDSTQTLSSMAAGARQVGTPSSVAANTVPFPPPPRRGERQASGVLRKTPPGGKDEMGPPLPPRRDTGNLMDDDGQGIGGWKPLKPQ